MKKLAMLLMIAILGVGCDKENEEPSNSNDVVVKIETQSVNPYTLTINSKVQAGLKGNRSEQVIANVGSKISVLVEFEGQVKDELYLKATKGSATLFQGPSVNGRSGFTMTLP